MDETWGYIHTSQRKWRWSNSKQPRWNAETGVLEPLMAFIHLAFWNWMIFSPSTFWYVNWLIKNWWIKMHFVQQKHISETCNSSSILKVGSVNNWFHNWFYCSLLVPSLYSLASEHQGAGFRLVTYIVSHDMAPKKTYLFPISVPYKIWEPYLSQMFRYFPRLGSWWIVLGSQN